MSTLSQNELSDLKDKLSDHQLDPDDLKNIGARLKEWSYSNDIDQRIAETASLLSQLIELSIETLDDEDSKASIEFRNYVRDNVDIIARDDEAIDFSKLDEFLINSREQFKEYFDCCETGDRQIDDLTDDWIRPELEQVDSMNESAEPADELDLAETSKQQLGLLLSALGEPPEKEILDPVESDETIEEETSGSDNDRTAECKDAIEELLKDDDLCEAFLDDATRCLDSMESCSLDMEQGSQDDETLNQFCRELHTLKGASASVGLAALSASIHELESELEQSDDRSNEAKVELMLRAVDHVRSSVNKINSQDVNSKSASAMAPDDLMSNVNFGGNSSEDSLIRIRASKLDRLMDMLAELVVLRNRRESHISEFAEFNHELKRCASRLSYCSDEKSGGNSSFLNSTGTLSELAKDISVLSDGICELQSPVTRDNVAISHFIRDFRQELMQLRRIPLSGLFNRIQRSARDAAKQEGKRLRFEISGEESGLERELQEKLFEPLLHIVRNAVSHGIEMPESRERAGKPSEGLIRLEAQSNSQMLMIKICDDGNGLDYDAIRRRAVDKGLINSNQMVGNAELGNLIFHPGFSTRQSTSQVSGRGVGMDVALTAVEQLRGRIEIQSEAGQGTSMVLVVPMQTGIEHAMVFRASGQLFALPMQAVDRVQSKSESDYEEFVSVAKVLSMTEDHSNSASEILFLKGADESFSKSDKRQRDSKRTGFAVSEILGPEEVVVRNLPALLKPHPLFCGLTLSGSGETVLLLDADRLISFAKNVNSTEQQANDNSPGIDQSLSKMVTVLVVDDSLSARKLLSKKLASYGFQVVEAGDGLEGLEQIRHNEFDVVFTDLDMPRLGGMELLVDLQQRRTEQAVVVVSSRSEDDFRDRALQHGASDYLTKPVDDRELKQILMELNLIQ